MCVLEKKGIMVQGLLAYRCGRAFLWARAATPFRPARTRPCGRDAPPPFARPLWWSLAVEDRLRSLGPARGGAGGDDENRGTRSRACARVRNRPCGRDALPSHSPTIPARANRTVRCCRLGRTRAKAFAHARGRARHALLSHLTGPTRAHIALDSTSKRRVISTTDIYGLQRDAPTDRRIAPQLRRPCAQETRGARNNEDGWRQRGKSRAHAPL